MFEALIVVLVAFSSFWVGWFCGRYAAEQELDEIRSEMQVDEEDPYDKLFK